MSTSAPVKQTNPGVYVPEGSKRIAIRVRGVTPLLFNGMSEEVAQGLYDKVTGQKNKVKPEERTPRQVAESKIHLDPITQKPCIPFNMLMATLINGGKSILLEGKSKMSKANGETRITGFLSFEETHFLIKPEKWEVDKQIGQNNNAGASCAIGIIRPRFDEWQFNCTVQVDTEIIHEKMIRHLFDLALSRIGLGSSRIMNGGCNGRAVVDQWELL